MKKVFLTIIVVIIIVNFSCNTENLLVENDFELYKLDTLKRELKEGIFLSCDSLQNSYTLNQPIISYINLENKSNKEGLRIHIGSYPPFLYWYVLDSNEQLVSAGPTEVGLSVYDDTLRIGKVLRDQFKWNHQMSDPNEMYSGLKAFSGNYKIELIFAGIPSIMKPYLIKYFEITEFGEPLSSNLYRYYRKLDSVNYDFILRNRVKKEIVLTKAPTPSYIFFYNESQKDTVYKYSFTLDKPIYILSGHSDNILARFRNSKKYFIDRGITGAFRIIIKLNFVERVITDDNLLFIL